MDDSVTLFELLVFSPPAALISLDDFLSNDDPGVSADQFADHFGVTLSTELRHWISQGLWRIQGPGEFCQPVPPARLIEAPEDFIWPALMPPDFLPLVGNGAGDWLCARVNDESHVEQIVHWYHGGGDWIPWGTRLAEAILFDSVWPMLPGPHRRHAIEAEPRRIAQEGGLLEHPWMKWVVDQLGNAVGDLAHRATSEPSVQASGKIAMELASGLIDRGIAETAVRCEMVQFAQQEWPLVESHCRAVLSQTEELAWPWEWLGLAKQSLGCAEAAKAAWIRAATCSAFTDQSVRMQPSRVTGIESPAAAAGKFAVTMLRKMGVQTISESEHPNADYVNGLLASSDEDAKCFAFQYWQSGADERHQRGDFAGEVAMLTRAGWDLGTEPMSVYGDLLTRIAKAARSAGQLGRSRLAEVHAAVWTG